MNKVLKTIKYGKNHIEYILQPGEEHSPEYLTTELGQRNYCAFIEQGFIEQPKEEHSPEDLTTDNTVDVENTFKDLTTDNTVDVENTFKDLTTDNAVDVENTFKVLYKTKEKLKDKDGNNIRKGSKLTEKEIEELGLDFIFLLEGDKIEETKSGK